jgi:hypothetical protein
MDSNSAGSAARLSRYEQKRKKKQISKIQNCTNNEQIVTGELPNQQNPMNDIQNCAEPDIYAEVAVWLCTNLRTGYKTRIHGALAQILKKYPEDYRLSLLSTQEFRP